MAFISGLFLIDAPASALNNGEGEDTLSMVKNIRTRGGDYPYVSAQAYRYWLRTTLEKLSNGWSPSPVYSAGKGKKQQAYTKGDPISYDDDDLLGYMRATKEETVTRVSPFRTSTLISIAPVRVTEDFGVMARVEKEAGDKEGVLLHGHQFYRTTLKGLFSLDLNAAGTFTNQMRSGFQNLGKEEIETAKARDDLEYLEELKAYRLPVEERIARVQRLLEGMAYVDGGANHTLHYTDVTPAFFIAAVTRGGNNIFGHIIKEDKGEPTIHAAALQQALSVYRGDMLSPVYVGRVQGYMDATQSILDELELPTQHPREALAAMATDLGANPAWMD